MSTNFSLLSNVNQFYTYFLISDLQPIHVFYSQFSLFHVVILNESETFTHTSLRISMYIYIFDLTKRFKEFFQFRFLNLRQLLSQSSYKNLRLTTNGLLLLLDRICRFNDSHLSRLFNQYFAAAAALFFSACECWTLKPMNSRPFNSNGRSLIVNAFWTASEV